MKRFLRSVAGKTIMIIAFILAACISVACIVGAAVMLDMDIYTMTQEEALRDIHYCELCNELSFYAIDVIVNNWRDVPLPNNLIVMIYDENDEVYSVSRDMTDSDLSGFDEYTFYLGVLGPENAYTDVYMTELKTNIEIGKAFTLKAYVTPHAYINETEALTVLLTQFAYKVRYAVFPIGAFSVILAVILFVVLMCVSGWHPDSDELVPGFFFKVPFDLMLAVLTVLFVSLAALLGDLLHGDMDIFIAIAAYAVALTVVFVLLSMSFASRVKQHELIKHCVIYYIIMILWKILRFAGKIIKNVFKWIIDLFRALPMVWHAALIILAVMIVEFTVMLSLPYDFDSWVIFRIFEMLFIGAGILFGTVTMRKLQKAGEVIAAGDLDYKIDTAGMYWDFKKHAENLNSISDGMARAVEQRIKSEHMKTELITNVSHDIKTPLTSIINYSTLIANEKSENERIAEYSEVLLRQSEKLKRLIDDLVEVSKANSGNLDVHPAVCDASLFISQSAGEYEEKLQKANLELVSSLPEEEIKIMADSRRMWRVFDNLMNNICKYSLPGSRVYLSLLKRADCAVITFKNTSRDALNIEADELMERFVRGDSSRNTDGNGLGLSIAQSLTELQGGTFDIVIDGDLFKVTLTFPIL